MIAFFILLLIVAVLVERWSLRHALDGVKYDLKLSRALVEPGETFQLISTLTNRQRRIVPFIKLSEDIPRALLLNAKVYTGGFDEHRARLNSSVYMMPRQKLTRRYDARLMERGRYLFTGATLFGGDFLGLSEKIDYAQFLREAVVLPKRLATPDVSETLGGYLGDISVNRFILEDPVLTLGFYEYTGREPMKQISWPVSARMGRLMVKNYDHTLELTVTVVLNVDTQMYGMSGYPLMETCYSMARDVCETLEEKRIPYRFLTNAIAPGMIGAWFDVAAGLGGAHLSTILEGLGRATYARRDSARDLIDGACRKAESGRAHILITPLREDFEPVDLDRLGSISGAKTLVLVAREVEA